MNEVIEYFRNRWACIDNDIDIPLLDYVICGATIPIFIFGFIVVIATVPVWGIPYVIYRVYWSEKRKND